MHLGVGGTYVPTCRHDTAMGASPAPCHALHGVAGVRQPTAAAPASNWYWLLPYGVSTGLATPQPSQGTYFGPGSMAVPQEKPQECCCRGLLVSQVGV